MVLGHSLNIKELIRPNVGPRGMCHINCRTPQVNIRHQMALEGESNTLKTVWALAVYAVFGSYIVAINAPTSGGLSSCSLRRRMVHKLGALANGANIPNNKYLSTKFRR